MLIDILISMLICGFVIWMLKKSCDHEFEDYEK